jgi:hypothetical protein
MSLAVWGHRADAVDGDHERQVPPLDCVDPSIGMTS